MPRLEQPLCYSQNFLRDPGLVDYLLDCSSICCDDLVYDIGAGTGVITERLARRCRHVVAIEKDPFLAAHLQARFRARPNIVIHAADFLHLPLPNAPFKVFANIPFASAAAIVTKLTAARAVPVDTYLIVQREAAERFVGSPRATLCAALLYPWFAASVIHCFQPSDFRPVPSVESVLLRLRWRDHALVPAADRQFYRDFVVFAFTATRPGLRSTLRTCLDRRLADRILHEAQLHPAATPSMVPGTLWLLLFEHLKDAGGVRGMQLVAGAERRLRQQQSCLQKVHRTRVHVPRL